MSLSITILLSPGLIGLVTWASQTTASGLLTRAWTRNDFSLSNNFLSFAGSCVESTSISSLTVASTNPSISQSSMPTTFPATFMAWLISTGEETDKVLIASVCRGSTDIRYFTASVIPSGFRDLSAMLTANIYGTFFSFPSR